MRCPDCGAELQNNSRFCHICGSSLLPGSSYQQLSSDTYVTMSSEELTDQTAQHFQAQKSSNAISINPLLLLVGALVLVILSSMITAFVVSSRMITSETGLENGVYRSADGMYELIVRTNSGSLNLYFDGALLQRKECFIGEDKITTSLIVDYHNGQIDAAKKPADSSSERVVGTYVYSTSEQAITLTLNDDQQAEVVLTRSGMGDGKEEWAQAREDFSLAREQFFAENTEEQTAESQDASETAQAEAGSTSEVETTEDTEG